MAAVTECPCVQLLPTLLPVVRTALGAQDPAEEPDEPDGSRWSGDLGDALRGTLLSTPAVFNTDLLPKVLSATSWLKNLYCLHSCNNVVLKIGGVDQSVECIV